MALFVCDASVAIAGLADDEADPACEQLLVRAIMEGATAPALMPYEIANILTLKLRRKLISAEGRRRALQSILALNLVIDVVDASSPAFSRTIALADAHRLTVYDAAYLELAMRLGAPLATLDTALAKVARAEKVEILPP